GADVRLYVTRGGVEHISAGVAGMPVAVGWVARRLARLTRPAPPRADGLPTRRAA
ncbi:MAG: hypothetical protein JO181_17620, partial [Solirubrobacterales bacterium]|nr:hypothetical protein [Solirubrobacterales bacterium]